MTTAPGLGLGLPHLARRMDGTRTDRRADDASRHPRGNKASAPTKASLVAVFAANARHYLAAPASSQREAAGSYVGSR
ncbi:hypothetical protein DCS_07105 [Drechmeria coniospora]|uniref:Uncharacterized protein n=1 Tax=Drechmeria coniospora TaxID=98403 RepID=A0A151GDK9_DRECN|nr:hypothetical protein DCS_07105 [Drechmeria coniospora]KYK55143.1 hypothetical protein DCS_07105 [Drechmeria coniospora]